MFIQVFQIDAKIILFLYYFSSQLSWSHFYKMNVQNQKCYFEDWTRAQVKLYMNGGICIFDSATFAQHHNDEQKQPHLLNNYYT